MRTFVLEYSLLKNGEVVKQGKMKIKNVSDSFPEFNAKVKLDKFLSKSFAYDNMVVHKCTEDFLGGFSAFNDIFNKFSSY